MQLTLKELIKITRLSGEHFSCFVSILSFSSLLAMIDTSALYAQFLSHPLTPPSVRNYVSTVKLLHVITGHSISQFTSYELRITLRGLERLAQHVLSHAPPVTPAILCKLVSQVNLQDPSLVSYCVAFLFTFFLLARVSNIVPRSRSRMHASFCRRRSDIVFTTDGFLVTFHCTKTIQFGRQRLSLPLLSMLGSPICPVHMFSLMCSLVPAPSDSPAFVFPGAGGKLVPIVKSQFVSVFCDLLRRTEIPDSDRFPGHSFHRGAASWAFHLGVPGEIIQVYGD